MAQFEGNRAPVITVTTGEAAWALLRDESFIARWTQLLERCAWATPLQAPAFVRIWFDHYRLHYQPVLAWSTNPDETLRSLVVLTPDAARRELLSAGTYHAEYQAWLCDPEDAARLLDATLAALDHAFPGYAVRFRYLPPRLPTAAVLGSAIVAARGELHLHRRPLMRIDAAEVEESFRKKSNKSRFNRLQRVGELKFERVTDRQRFDQLFDRIIACYDFRQGAAHDSLPFTDDPVKRAFHLALLQANPDLLHVTVTTLDGEPVAAHLGVIDQDEVHLAILAYSPFLARHSPGKLHLMLLARLLAQEGFDRLDLTPGGDAWKERFANGHDEVWELLVHPTARARRRAELQAQALARMKTALRRVGLTPAKLRSALESLRRANAGSVLRRLRRAVREHHEFRVYRLDASAIPALAGDFPLKRDHLPDLLKFTPAERWQSKQAFLSAALERLERGEHVYTFADGERLLHYGWLIEEQRQGFFSEVRQRFDYPDHSAVLYDFYTDPAARGRGLYQQSLRRILRDAAGIAGLRHVYISVLAANLPSRRVIEKIGFVYQCSLVTTRLFGRLRQSRSDGPVLPYEGSEATGKDEE